MDRSMGTARRIASGVALAATFALVMTSHVLAGEAFPQAIEDNSFFVEEAYNQEDRVVQHISNAVYSREPIRSLGYSFTQEWPVGSQAHQFSFTIPYSFLGEGLGGGLGDVLINYRYQLSGHDAWITVAPTLSLILATGDEEEGFGAGANGLQFNLPMSKRVNAHLVLHANAGATVLHGVDGAGAVEKNLRAYNLGGSAIGLVTPRFNLMLETVALISDELDSDGGIARSTETVVSPGLRYAINRGSLQIVPGIAFPVTFSDGETNAGAFFYLSLEHPF